MPNALDRSPTATVQVVAAPVLEDYKKMALYEAELDTGPLIPGVGTVGSN